MPLYCLQLLTCLLDRSACSIVTGNLQTASTWMMKALQFPEKSVNSQPTRRTTLEDLKLLLDTCCVYGIRCYCDISLFGQNLQVVMRVQRKLRYRFLEQWFAALIYFIQAEIPGCLLRFNAASLTLGWGISCLSWNLEFLHIIRLNPILTQINPVHTITAIRSSSDLILSSHLPMDTSLVDQFWYQVPYGSLQFINQGMHI